MPNETNYDYRADPVLAEALAYWKAKRGGRSMPARRDIDPTEIPKLLPHVQLIDIMPEWSLSLQVGGQPSRQSIRSRLTGQYAGELFEGPRGESIIMHHRTVCVAGQPVFARSRYIIEKKIDLIANRLYLPLSSNDLDVNMIFGVLTLVYGVAPIAGEWGTARFTAADVEIVDASS